MARQIENPAQSNLRFFVFQDIITCVSGVLIFIVLLMTVNLGSFVTASRFVVDAKRAEELKRLLDRLAQLVTENTTLQSQLATVQTMPKRDDLEAEIKTLKSQLEELGQQQKALADNAELLNSAQAEKESALGLKDLREQIQKLKDELAKLKEANRTASQQVAALESEVKTREGRLLEAESNARRLWLIPDFSDTSKEPVIVVISDTAVTLERFNKREGRIEIKQGDIRKEFQKALKQFNPLNQYIVFYLKPSAIGRFEDFLTVAKNSRFEIGYDALEEDKELQLSLPGQSQ
jgi:DNA repair exonuclease SbcCD ATPase subunit